MTILISAIAGLLAGFLVPTVWRFNSVFDNYYNSQGKKRGPK